MSRQASDGDSVLVELVAKAVEAGADVLEVEYRDGHEEVCAFHGDLGFGIARLPSREPEGRQLRNDLHALRGKTKKVLVSGVEYVLRVTVFDSFGETAFRISSARSSPPR